MSSIGLFSGLHSKYEDYEDLIDSAMVEIETDMEGRSNTSCDRLIDLLEEISAPVEEVSLRTLIFVGLMSDMSGKPIDDFAALATLLKEPKHSNELLTRLNRLAGHLESERAVIAQRMAL